MLGLYIHIPFCARRCPYCDFAIVAGAKENFVVSYIEALRQELASTLQEAREKSCVGRELSSIFFGGGTPSSLDTSTLVSLLQIVFDSFPIASDAEISLEANPEDATSEKFAVLREAGFNRVSFGAQSFDDEELRFLGRRHNAAQIEYSVAVTREAGFQNISLDLIYALPQQTRAGWESTLRRAVDLGVSHLSCYSLTIEDGTAFGRRAERGALALTPDDAQAELMQDAENILMASGYERYEISNYARPGFASRHNQNYWRVGDYLACGCSAHGHLDGHRWWNERDAKKYVALIQSQGQARAGEEFLTSRQRLDECVMLGLRTREGFNLHEVSNRLGCDARSELNGELDDLLTRGVLARHGEAICLAPSAVPLADAVTSRLLSGI